MKEGSPIVRFLFVAVFTAFFILPVQAQSSSQNRSTITGYVFDRQRNPVPRIPVELMNEVNSVVARTRTDGSGRFVFGGLSQGRFQIRVLPLGTNFEEQTQEVELVSFNMTGRGGTDNAQKDFYLQLRRGSNTEGASAGTIFAQEVPGEAQKIYERAVSALDDKKEELAVEELKKALEAFPTYYLALEKLGSIYISRQKYDNARDVFDRAVAVNPRSFNAWYGLGYANHSLQKPKAAIEATEKSVSINSSSVVANIILGMALRQDKQYERAEKTFKQAAKFSNGKIPDVHWNLALLYAHNLKRYKDAANELELYIKANPNNHNTETVKKLIKQFREKQ